MSRVLVLGATGRVGRQVASALCGAGHEVLVAGRDRDRVRAVADTLALPQDAAYLVDVQDPEAVKRAVGDAEVTVSTVGPFMLLGKVVIDSCIAAGTTYVDIANEQPAVAALLSRDAEAREMGATLVTGAGLGLVAVECLARRLADACTAPRGVRSTLLTWNSAPSDGVRASVAAALQVGATRYVGGQLVHEQIGSTTWQLALLGRKRTLVAAPVGEVEAVHRATGAPDVAAFAELPPGAGVDAIEPVSAAHVEVTDEDGAVRAATVELGDSVAATARIVERTVSGAVAAGRPGAWTPAALLGADAFSDTLRVTSP